MRGRSPRERERARESERTRASERERENESERTSEGDRERDSERARERQGEGGGGRERERESARARERERESESEGGSERCVNADEAAMCAPAPRLIDSCVTRLKAQGPSRTCDESKEEEEAPRLCLDKGAEWLIDFVYHSTLGLRVMHKKMKKGAEWGHAPQDASCQSNRLG